MLPQGVPPASKMCFSQATPELETYLLCQTFPFGFFSLGSLRSVPHSVNCSILWQQIAKLNSHSNSNVLDVLNLPRITWLSLPGFLPRNYLPLPFLCSPLILLYLAFSPHSFFWLQSSSRSNNRHSFNSFVAPGTKCGHKIDLRSSIFLFSAVPWTFLAFIHPFKTTFNTTEQVFIVLMVLILNSR